MHMQVCKVLQAGWNLATLPSYSGQTLKHGGNILLQKLPINVTASLPIRYKSWNNCRENLIILTYKLPKEYSEWLQCTQFLTPFKRLGSAHILLHKQVQCTISTFLEFCEHIKPSPARVVKICTLSRVTWAFSLTLSLLMSYIYGTPCKARNFNVVYIWTYRRKTGWKE
jgi:hypothetical protein